MSSCMSCDFRINNNNNLLCPKCKRNPFVVEIVRDILAGRGDLESFKSTYNMEYAEIHNQNTSIFWDKKLKTVQLLKDQDGMTQDRVKAAACFIPKDANKILDIGAGNGFVEELILDNKKIEFYGNDISTEAIKNLQKRFKGTFKVESVYNLKYKKEYFDVVLALEVLEHILPTKIFDVLRSIRAIIKTYGTFILSIPTNEGLESKKDNLSGHIRAYTIPIIKTELEISGFKIVDLKTFSAFSKYYALKKTLKKILPKKWHANDIVIRTIKI